MIVMTQDDPPALIGFLPSHIELPCLDGTSSVLLSYRTYEHICTRRENESPEHLALVLSRMSAVIAEPSHVGCLSGERHKLDLWARHPDDVAGVLVSLKCLSGETWVNTAFPLEGRPCANTYPLIRLNQLECLRAERLLPRLVAVRVLPRGQKRWGSRPPPPGTPRKDCESARARHGRFRLQPARPLPETVNLVRFTVSLTARATIRGDGLTEPYSSSAPGGIR